MASVMYFSELKRLLTPIYAIILFMTNLYKIVFILALFVAPFVVTASANAGCYLANNKCSSNSSGGKITAGWPPFPGKAAGVSKAKTTGSGKPLYTGALSGTSGGSKCLSLGGSPIKGCPGYKGP